jgi:hypothetical protein
MARNLKSPQVDQGPNIKAPEQVEPPPQQRKPKFSLEFLSKAYCLSNCQQLEKAAFADAILTLTQLTWAQIGQAPRHGLGFEKIDRKSITGKDSAIPNVITDDVNIIAFRFHGKAPMVGFRREDTFFVVWLDRAFSLYNHH